MDADMAADYINDWLGDENLSAILEKHSNIRAIFNDSYEFYSDLYYTESIGYTLNTGLSFCLYCLLMSSSPSAIPVNSFSGFCQGWCPVV